MTYNTGNPIGSTDARDRSDNSENLDLAVNSLALTFEDRLGVTRDTLEGIYQKSAYYRAGTFDAGYTLTNNRQTLAYGNVEYSWSGSFPKVVSAGSTPATSGGIGAGAWVDRTDSTLRSEVIGGDVSIISYIHPEQFGAQSGATGATGVGVDSSQAFIDAAAECLLTGKTLKATGSYRITMDVDLRYINIDMTNCKLYIDSATAQVKIGGNASSQNNPCQYFGSVSRIGGVNGTPELRLSGVKCQNIHVEYAEYAMVWASTTSGVRDQEYSCAYSNIHFKYCWKLELNTDPLNASGSSNSNVGGSIQWINENNFYLNRCNTLIVDGSYDHNHNRFYAGTFENASVITFTKGRDNRMYGERFEGQNCVVTFGATTERNVIINTFDDSEYNGGPEVSTTTVNDSGSQNIVADDFRLYYKTETVSSIDTSDVVLNNEVGDITVRQPYLQCLQGSSGSPISVSEFLLAVEGNYYFYNSYGADSGDTPLYRPYITFYDKDFNKLTPLSSWIASGTMLSVSGTDLQTGSGVSNSICRITGTAISAGAVFVRVGWKASNTQLSNGLARKLTVISATKNKHSTSAMSVQKQTQQNKIVSAVPTKGFAPLGFVAYKSDMSTRYLNKFSLSTTVSGVTDASNITVTTVTGVAVGDVVGINLSDRTTHWTTVSSISGSAITFAVSAAVIPEVSARIVFNRWYTEAI